MSYHRQKKPYQAPAIQVQWADTYILKRHLSMYLEQGYKVIGVNICPILRQCAGRRLCHEAVKAKWEPIRKSAQNVPKEVMEDFEANKAGLKPLKLVRDNRARPDQAKSNIDKQGYQMPVQDREVSAFLHEPSSARLIIIDPNDTVNPDQDIKPTFKYISMSPRDKMLVRPWPMFTTPLASYAAQLLCAASASSTAPSDTRSCTNLKYTNIMVIWTSQQPLHAC